MDKLAALSTFAQAAELRSFTAAGRKLGMSSSAVGKTPLIALAENGARLTGSTHGHVRLEAGKVGVMPLLPPQKASRT